jgi:photosystem II stability/assembly factor-like uncharacterized protein
MNGNKKIDLLMASGRQYFRRFRINWCTHFSISWMALLVILPVTFFGNTQVAYAHSPHDVVTQLAITPNFQEDQLLFAIVRKNLIKSENGGETWIRPFQGLDNHHNLTGVFVASDGKVFASSEGDGVYLSEDYGNNWRKISNGLTSLNISLLCASEKTPSTLLARDADNDLHVTYDAGGAWSRTLQNHKVSAMACSKYNNQLLVVDEDQNLLLSQDGNSWEVAFRFSGFGKINTLEVIPDGEVNSILVGTQKGEILKSSDNGLSFVQLKSHPISDSIQDIESIANEQGVPFLFVSTWHDGLYISKDNGETWQKYSRGLTKTGQADEYNEPHFSQIAVANKFEENETIFLAGFNGLFKTKNGGENWQELDTLSARTITSMAISPNYEEDSTLAIGSYNKEAYISRDAGESWQLINTGLTKILFNRYGRQALEVHRPRFYNLSFSPSYQDDNSVFAVLNYYFFKSKSSGKSWQEINIDSQQGYSRRGQFIALSPNFEEDQRVYLVSRYGGLVYESTDAGESFTIVGAVDENINSLTISPNHKNDRVLFVSSSKGIYKTTDSGQTWNIMTPEGDWEDITWRTVAISPNYDVDQTVFAGTDRGLFKTQDGGENWISLEDAIPGEGDNIVKVIAVSPDYAQDKTILIGAQGKGILRSLDGGNTFLPIGNELREASFPVLPFDTVPISCENIQFSPAYREDKTIFAFGSADAEVFKSTDGGDTWEIIFVPPQANYLSDNVSVGFAYGLRAVGAYPYLRFIPALLGAICAYLLTGKFFKSLKRISRKRVQLFSSVFVFALIFGLISILF